MKNFFNIDVWKINRNFEDKITKDIKGNKISYMNNYDKKVLALKDDKSTTIEIIKKENLKAIPIQNENNDSINIMNSFQLNNSSFFNQPIVHTLNIYQSLSESTFFDSKISKNSNNSIIEYEHPLHQFNSLGSNFYLKNKINDIPLTDEINNFKNNNNLLIYKINDDLFGFIYPNDLITYSITISAFLADNNILNYDLNYKLKENKSRYYSLLGIYFCGKTEEIKIENKVYIKKCLPNEFLCKDCLKINKIKYKLKNSYLINANGRVTRMNKGNHHCFGHFLSGNQIEDCISKFSCEACKMINFYLEYFIKKS